MKTVAGVVTLAREERERTTQYGVSERRNTDFQAAATTSRHVLIAAVRSVRCVWAELKWRWTLKVLKTAACVERNFWCAGETGKE